jgi:acetyl esterase/lipase
MLWMHGGGLVAGAPENDEGNNIEIVRELGIAVAAVAYRLAPRHPFPCAIEDCYAGLKWLHAEAEALGLRADRLFVGGASAGGGLAAGLAMLARDRGDVPVAFQLLVYPMIDDRTVLRTDIDTSHVRLWSAADNRYAWGAYLKGGAGRGEVNPYAAPARRDDLSGLPPAWLGVGELDLFHDEDVAFASRLSRAGVPCELHVVPGAFHGFDRFKPTANVARQFRQSYLEALRRASA